MRTTRWMIVGSVVLALTLLVTLSSSRRIESYSCAECRNRKRVETHLLLGIPLQPRVTREEINAVPADHQHDWWRYADYEERGPGGIFGKTVACQPYQYRDGRERESLASHTGDH